MLIDLLTVMTVAGAVFFLVMATILVATRKRAGRIALAQQDAWEADQKLREKVPAKTRILHWLERYGYRGDITPVLGPLTVGYGLVVLALLATGLPGLIALLAAIPASALVAWLAAEFIADRRRRKFDRQLLELFQLLAGQIEGGVGIRRGLEHSLGAVSDPLRTEMLRVLNSAVASKDLVAAMRVLERRYPSRAMSLFVAAIEIEQDLGGEIVPALRQAADSLQTSFDLIEEAKAEVSQAKMEFYALVAIIGGTTLWMFSQADTQTREAFTNPIALFLIAFGLLNFAFGIFRGARTFRKITAGD